MKNVLLIFILLLCSLSFFGQTLVRYGNKTISLDEFLTAYRKNNSKVKATEKSYREYLDLYIRYRLKVQEALDKKLDTLPGQITELQNFKSQIADQYTNDESSLSRMAEEAFLRSRKDLKISYIFVAAPRNASPADSAKAWKKIQDAYQALEKNADFGETALLYSEDPYVKNNRGDIGFITVFDLPYAMENVAYQLPPFSKKNDGSGLPYSLVFRMESGYAIVKKTAERPALGRIRIAQILVAYPYQADEAAKEKTRLRADSIYQAIRAGADFAGLAKKFSGDNLSYQMGGNLPEFGIGKYEAGFEQTAFGLRKDGELSEPYASAFGYHIIKRIARIPVPAKADSKVLNAWKEKIKLDPRIKVSRSQMMQTILKQTGFKENIPEGNVLWDYTDSCLQNNTPPAKSRINSQTILFEVSDRKFTVGDWIAYRKSLISSPQLTNGKKNSEILDAYKQAIAFQYYKDHLEMYNAAYAEQVLDFRDGNLLFEIMQEQIWNKAAADSIGLKKYFTMHAEKYRWQPGAEAIIFTSADKLTAEKLGNAVTKNINNWKQEADRLGEQVQADSGRFEWKQIPGNGKLKPGTKFTENITVFTSNHTPPSVQFAYIIRNYPGASPRSFEEARGMVVNDYQNELENQWIADLKKKYPVMVNEKVFSTLPK